MCSDRNAQVAYALAGKVASSSPYVLIAPREMLWDTGTQSKDALLGNNSPS